jgi:hypothetical protein
MIFSAWFKFLGTKVTLCFAKFPPFSRRDAPMSRRHCGDELPDDCPTEITSCRSYANWKAKQKGDTLTEEFAVMLIMFECFFALDAASRDGLENLPDLD